MLSLVRFLLGLGLVLTSLFLIFLVLIQRGRGGGLAGAFGGAGGQSAFGTKAGDVFSRKISSTWRLASCVGLRLQASSAPCPRQSSRCAFAASRTAARMRSASRPDSASIL